MSGGEAFVGAVVIVAMFAAPMVACIAVGRVIEAVDRKTSERAGEVPE